MKKIGTLRPGVSIQPHQERVNQKLNRSGGVLVYHGLGSGKTLTSINATHDEPTDVIVPASLRENYKKELKSFAKKHKSHVMSYEKASKSSPSPGASALVVDEAHMAGRTDSQEVLT
jgi:ribosomal protein L30E